MSKRHNGDDFQEFCACQSPPMAYFSHFESNEREKRDDRQMSTRTSRKRPAAAAAEFEPEESEQDDITDGEPDGDNEAGSGSEADENGGLVPVKPKQ